MGRGRGMSKLTEAQLKTSYSAMNIVPWLMPLMKAYLQLSHFAKARALMEEMKKEGVQPNRVTLNYFINTMLAKSRSWGFKEIWAIVEEMQDADVKSSWVTCSTLLKGLNAHYDMQNIMRTMDLINTMDEATDEVLLSSLVGACVRIGKPERLSAWLE